MIVFQIVVLHKVSVALPVKIIFRTSKRDALQEARKRVKEEGLLAPQLVRVKKLIFKDLPPKKLVMAILNAGDMAFVSNKDYIESHETVWEWKESA